MGCFSFVLIVGREKNRFSSMMNRPGRTAVPSLSLVIEEDEDEERSIKATLASIKSMYNKPKPDRQIETSLKKSVLEKKKARDSDVDTSIYESVGEAEAHLLKPSPAEDASLFKLASETETPLIKHINEAETSFIESVPNALSSMIESVPRVGSAVVENVINAGSSIFDSAAKKNANIVRSAPELKSALVQPAIPATKSAFFDPTAEAKTSIRKSKVSFRKPDVASESSPGESDAKTDSNGGLSGLKTETHVENASKIPSKDLQIFPTQSNKDDKNSLEPSAGINKSNENLPKDKNQTKKVESSGPDKERKALSKTKEQSILQAKLTTLAVQIGYVGT